MAADALPSEETSLLHGTSKRCIGIAVVANAHGHGHGNDGAADAGDPATDDDDDDDDDADDDDNHDHDRDQHPSPPPKEVKTRARLVSDIHIILLVGFVMSMSFSYTQVPITYLFRQMVCEDYYSRHTPYTGDAEKCNVAEIEGPTARQLSLLGMSTTICGTFNLFLAGWMIKRFQPKPTLLIQTVCPAVRVFVQTVGGIVGGRWGILLFQTSQLMNLIGGTAGYILVINTMVSELSTAEARTATFGKLQGACMMGIAIGYLVGSVVGDAVDIILPFKLAFVSFFASSLIVALLAPSVTMPELVAHDRAALPAKSGFFSSLATIGPQRMRRPDGRPFRCWGLVLLVLGIFCGVLATYYAPFLINLYVIMQFNFSVAKTGYLMFMNFVIRGLFLIFTFPAIISWGRTWYASVFVPAGSPGSAAPDSGGRAFDLFFLRWSLVVDAAVTALAALAAADWQFFVVAALLPLASGSAAAAKGVVTELCRPAQRPDALQAVSLVESVATTMTMGLFGAVYAAFAEAGMAHLTFYCNAALAFMAAFVLLFSHFPPPGTRYDDDADDDDCGDHCGDDDGAA